jgi:hypothetical protein
MGKLIIPTSVGGSVPSIAPLRREEEDEAVKQLRLVIPSNVGGDPDVAPTPQPVLDVAREIEDEEIVQQPDLLGKELTIEEELATATLPQTEAEFFGEAPEEKMELPKMGTGLLERTAAVIPSNKEEFLKFGSKVKNNFPKNALEFGKSLVDLLSAGGDFFLLATEDPRAAGDKLDSFMESLPEVPEKVWEDIKTRYGGPENIRKSLEEKPFEFMMDLSGALSIAGLGSKIASVAKLPGVAKSLKIAGKVGQIIDPIGTPFRVVGKTLSAGAHPISKLLDVGFAEGLVARSKGVKQLTNTFSDEFTRVQKKTPSKWMMEKGIAGTPNQMSNQLGKVLEASRSSLDEGLASIPDTFQTDTVKGILGDMKRKLKVFKPDDIPVSQRGKARIAKIENLARKHDKSGLTLTEMNELKRDLNRQIELYQSGKSVLKKGKDIEELGFLKDELKEFIEVEANKKGFKNVKSMNMQTKAALDLKRNLDRAIISSFKNRGLGLTDFIFATTAGAGATAVGGTAAGLKIAAGALLVKKIAESPMLRTRFARVIQDMSPAGIKSIEQAMMAGRHTNKSLFAFSQLNAKLRRAGYPIVVRLDEDDEEEAY